MRIPKSGGCWECPAGAFNSQRANYLLLESASPRRLRWMQGFTLMELMVVLVLIGILAAVIVPEMKGSFEDALLRSSGRKLIDVCNTAYSRAVSFNQLHRIRLDAATGRYIIERESQNGTSEFEPAVEVAGFEGQIDPRIAIEIKAIKEGPEDVPDTESDEDPGAVNLSEGIQFYPDGTADSCAILLRDRMGIQLGLQINPVTARVEIIEKGEL